MQSRIEDPQKTTVNPYRCERFKEKVKDVGFAFLSNFRQRNTTQWIDEARWKICKLQIILDENYDIYMFYTLVDRSSTVFVFHSQV